MPRKTLIEYLDTGARWTGIPALAEGHPRRRPLRWQSTIALGLALAGFLMTFGQSDNWIWYGVLVLGFGLGNFIPIWGPLKPWGGTERVDEYDRSLRARAYLVAFTWLSAVAVFGTWAIVGFSAAQNWDVNMLRLTLVKMGFLMAAIYSAGPTCYASWVQKPVNDDV